MKEAGFADIEIAELPLLPVPAILMSQGGRIATTYQPRHSGATADDAGLC
jgi:hypothetical protein